MSTRLPLAVVVVTAWYAAPLRGEPVTPAPSAKVRVLERNISEAEWNALTDDAAIELQGRRLTKRELKVEIESRWRSQPAVIDAVAQRARQRMQARKAELVQESQKRLAGNRPAMKGVAMGQKTGAATKSACSPKIVKVQIIGQTFVGPGDRLTLTGTCVFEKPKLKLAGAFPGGSLTLIPGSWSSEDGNYEVSGTVPEVSGVTHQTATVVLMTDHGNAEGQVIFAPRHDVRILSKADVTAFCSTASPVHDCTTPSDYTFRGVHKAGVFDVEGKDFVKTILKNQWVITECIFESHTSGGNTSVQLGSGATIGSGCTAGDDRLDLEFRFSLDPVWPYLKLAVESHALAVVVEGPVGLPYK